MLEDVARVWFIRAVRDVLPTEAAAVESSGRLNPYAISLDPARWEKEGLFKGTPSRPTLIEKDIRYYCGEINLSWLGLAGHLLRFYAWNHRIEAPETAAVSRASFEPIKFCGRAITMTEWWRSFLSLQRAMARVQ